MRTAAQIIEKIAPYSQTFEGGDNNLYLEVNVISLINIARKEAIEECAKRAKATMVRQPFVGMLPEVNQQSILSLIDELK